MTEPAKESSTSPKSVKRETVEKLVDTIFEIISEGKDARIRGDKNGQLIIFEEKLRRKIV